MSLSGELSDNNSMCSALPGEHHRGPAARAPPGGPGLIDASGEVGPTRLPRRPVLTTCPYVSRIRGLARKLG